MWLLLPALLLSTTVLSSPLTAQEEEISSLEAEHRLVRYKPIIRLLTIVSCHLRTSVGDAFDSIAKELRESAVYPILLNPLSVRKETVVSRAEF